MKSAEQQARDMLDRLGVADAQSFANGDVIELANLIAGTNGGGSPRCEHCRFYVPSSLPGQKHGECYRYPPSTDADYKSDGIARRPGVHERDWCGEFKHGGGI